MITNEGSTRIVIIITSWAGVRVLGRSPVWTYCENALFLFLNPRYSWAKIRQSAVCLIMITNEKSTRIVIFMASCYSHGLLGGSRSKVRPSKEN